MRSAFISSEFSYESLIIGVVRSGAVTFVLVLFPGDVVAANPAPYSFVIAKRNGYRCRNRWEIGQTRLQFPLVPSFKTNSSKSEIFLGPHSHATVSFFVSIKFTN
jgi:hypothetical protein